MTNFPFTEAAKTIARLHSALLLIAQATDGADPNPNTIHKIAVSALDDTQGSRSLAAGLLREDTALD